MNMDIIEEKLNNLIKTVFENCNEEKNMKNIKYSFEYPVLRAASYTGISPAVIKYKFANKANSKTEFIIDIFERVEIYKRIKHLYAEDYFQLSKGKYIIALQPHLTTLLEIDELKTLLNQMGFEFRKLRSQSNEILVENPEIATERFTFLKKIHNARQCDKNIYYVDERFIDVHRNIKRPWTMDADYKNNADTGIYFYHIASKHGSNGLFSNRLAQEDYEKWLLNIVLPTLIPSSVIVLGPSLNHTPILTKTISKYDSKDAMIAYLKSTNIPFRSDMHKSELYDLVQKYPKPCVDKYTIDKILKGHGFEVLHLPYSLYDLSMAEMLWKNILVQPIPEVRTDLLKLKKLIWGNMSITESRGIDYDNILQNAETHMYEYEVETDSALEKIEFATYDDMMKGLETEEIIALE